MVLNKFLLFGVGTLSLAGTGVGVYYSIRKTEKKVEEQQKQVE